MKTEAELFISILKNGVDSCKIFKGEIERGFKRVPPDLQIPTYPPFSDPVRMIEGLGYLHDDAVHLKLTIFMLWYSDTNTMWYPINVNNQIPMEVVPLGRVIESIQSEGSLLPDEGMEGRNISEYYSLGRCLMYDRDNYRVLCVCVCMTV